MITRKKPHLRTPRAGVTLTELLVVLVIVALMATLAVPVAINRAQQSKVTAARADAKMLAEAEEICAMIHGFYVPLQVLDDVPEMSRELRRGARRPSAA